MSERSIELFAQYLDLKTQVYANCIVEFEKDETYVKAPWTDDWIDIAPDNTNDEALDNPTTPPTAYNAVENATDHILTDPDTFVPVRPVKKDRVKAEERAERQRQFHDMFWHRVKTEQGDPLRGAAKSVVKGKMALKFSLRWDLLPDLPDNATPSQKSAYREKVRRVAMNKFIWKLESVAKETIFEDPDSPSEPRYVYEAYDARVDALRKLYPDAKTLEGREPHGRALYVEYYSQPLGESKGEHIVWIGEQEVVLEEDNPYSWETKTSTKAKKDYTGFVPYVIDDPGWGDQDADRKPEDRCVSIIRPIRSVVKAETRFLTEMEAMLRLYIWKILLAYGLSDAEIEKLEVGPGQVWKLPPRDENIDVGVFNFGEVPISLLQGMDRVNAYADEASKFGALGGTRQIGVDTATENDQLIRNAATKLSGPVTALTRAVTVINSWVLMTIENVIEAPVTMFGALQHGPTDVTLNPRDILGFYYTHVELQSSDEQALDARKGRLAAEFYSIFPGFAERMAMEQAGIDNPRESQRIRTNENLMRSEPIQAFLIQRALQALEQGLGPVGEAFNETMLRQGGGGGGQGTPERNQAGQNGAGNTVDQLVEDARQSAGADQSGRQLS